MKEEITQYIYIILGRAANWLSGTAAKVAKLLSWPLLLNGRNEENLSSTVT